MRSAVPVAILVASAFLLVTPPAAAQDECTASGAPNAPPCLTISCTMYASGNCTQFYDNCAKIPIPGTVTVPPSGTPVPPRNVYPPSPCKTYYVFLIPDYDGRYPNCVPGQSTTPGELPGCALANFPYTSLIWVESSTSPACQGLQRTPGSCPRDTPLALI